MPPKLSLPQGIEHLLEKRDSPERRKRDRRSGVKSTAASKASGEERRSRPDRRARKRRKKA